MRENATTVVRMVAGRDVSYDVIHPARSVFDLREDALAARLGGRDTLIVVDERVHALWGDSIRRYADRCLRLAGVLLVEGTEQAKSWAQVEQICATAVDARLSRDGAIVGIGGGSALDLAGLAASLFRRGVTYIRVPTTLVGMVDVGVG